MNRHFTLRLLGLVAVGCLARAQEGPPAFHSAAELESFLLPIEEQKVNDTMNLLFPRQAAGSLVSTAVKYGPANAAAASKAVVGEEFSESYRELSKYLDEFGPCKKLAAKDEQGWWSNYGDPPPETICTELVKIIYGLTLWNQIHYCQQLASGEVKPRIPVPEGKAPAYRLDEAPVKTVWLKSAELYSLADSAIELNLSDALKETSTRAPRVNEAAAHARAQLAKAPPSREFVAIALAELVIRNYQAMHLQHLATKRLQL